jgi:hypothetical protein
MIEILILLATIGIASAASGRDNSKSKDGESSNRTSLLEWKPDITSKSSIWTYEKPTKTFSSFASGYDSNRQIWWTRRDTWEIEEL